MSSVSLTARGHNLLGVRIITDFNGYTLLKSFCAYYYFQFQVISSDFMKMYMTRFTDELGCCCVSDIFFVIYQHILLHAVFYVGVCCTYSFWLVKKIIYKKNVLCQFLLARTHTTDFVLFFN